MESGLYEQCLLTLNNIDSTIGQLIKWNKSISTVSDYTNSEHGMQLLAANCTLITAIGEGINRIGRLYPGFLTNNFPEIPWRAIVGMRNHIAHGYFELDADIVFDVVNGDLEELKNAIASAIKMLQRKNLEFRDCVLRFGNFLLI